jgi:hypothetical protein
MAISAYPFGLNRVAGTQKMTSYFLPPSNFVPKVDLQRSFLTVLSRLANQSLAEGVSASGLGARASEAALYFAILADLEPVVAAANPPLIRNLSALKDSLYSVLPLQIREELTTMQEQHASQSRRSLKDAVDQAIREPSPARRNSAVASAVMNASSDESPESLVEAALRIDDLRLREELFNWLYFKLARKAIATGQYDEGRKLASKVSRLEWRAYLLYEAAAGTLKNQDRVRAREMLSEVSAAAYSAPNTDEKVRTLIGIAHLYSSFDRIDAQVAIMEAVKTINRLTKPNLGNTVLTLKIEAAGFSHFASYNVAAFNMDAVLREMAQVDLDGAVLIARKIEHPSLRAASLLALSAHCLEQPGTSPMPLNKQSVRNDGRER